LLPQTLTSFPYVVVRVDCTMCAKKERYRLARLADKYGANCTLKELLELLAGDCKYRGRPLQWLRPGSSRQMLTDSGHCNARSMGCIDTR